MTATFGSSVRVKGILLDIRARLPVAVRKFLDVDGKMLTLAMRAEQITFHVFDPRVVEDALDRSLVDEWRVADAEAKAEKRQRAAWNAKLARSLKKEKKKGSGSPSEQEEASGLAGWDDFTVTAFSADRLKWEAMTTRSTPTNPIPNMEICMVGLLPFKRTTSYRCLGRAGYPTINTVTSGRAEDTGAGVLDRVPAELAIDRNSPVDEALRATRSRNTETIGVTDDEIAAIAAEAERVWESVSLIAESSMRAAKAAKSKLSSLREIPRESLLLAVEIVATIGFVLGATR